MPIAKRTPRTAKWRKMTARMTMKRTMKLTETARMTKPMMPMGTVKP